MPSFEHAIFGNRDGSHQLLETSLAVDNPVLEDLRFLVDRPVGHIGQEVVWSPYWGCGPIRDWWVVWRGEEDGDAPRRNMVKARVVLLSFSQCDTSEHLDAALEFLYGQTPIEEDIAVSALVNALAHRHLPVVLPGISSFPVLLKKLWPRLWPNARKALSIRTLFGSESLESSGAPEIIVIPQELRPRWNSHNIIESDMQSHNPAALLFDGADAPELERLLQANLACLPKDLSALGRLERIVEKIKVIQSGKGSPADALLIVRTLQGFEEGIELTTDDSSLVYRQLCQLDSATISDIRAASLTDLTIFRDSIQEVASAVAKWVQKNLPRQSDNDALWILEQQTGTTHSSWWRAAVREGLIDEFRGLTDKWAKALWRWWSCNPQAVHWVKDLLPPEPSVEEVLLANIIKIDDRLLESLAILCKKHNWSKLLAGALYELKPLLQAVDYLRSATDNPEQGLDILLKGRKPDEIVHTAAYIIWRPLLDRAIVLTKKEPTLFSSVKSEDIGFRCLLAGHLEAGGAPPSIDLDESFTLSILDGMLAGDEDAAQIAFHFADEIGDHLITHPDQDAFWRTVPNDKLARLTEAASNAWLRAFVLGQVNQRPNPFLVTTVCSITRPILKGHDFERVLSFLLMFPEVSETEVVDWLSQDDFRWKEGDSKLLGDMLLERDWKYAARKFQSNLNPELKAAARHAQALIPPWDIFSWLMSSKHSKTPFPGTPVNNRVADTMGQIKIEEGKDPVVGIITIKEEEYQAVREKFNPSAVKHGENRTYDMATVETSNGKCLIAITRCLMPGNIYAQSAATELLSDLNPSFVLVVGIAGGIPTTDFCLGDVVVSNYIHDLTLEDTGISNDTRRFNALGGPLDTEASRIVERLPAHDHRDNSWSDSAIIGVPRPGIDREYTTEDDVWNKAINEALTNHAERTSPIVTATKIASSDRLVKFPDLIKVWRTVLKGAMAVEMESAGVYISCQRKKVPVLAIRGISDIIGLERDDAWTLYACHTAASFTKMLVETGVFCTKDNFEDQG